MFSCQVLSASSNHQCGKGDTERVCVQVRNNKKVLNPWISYWFVSSWDCSSSEMQMVRSRFTAVHNSPTLFGDSQMPRRMEGIFPTWVGFPTLVVHGNPTERDISCGAVSCWPHTLHFWWNWVILEGFVGIFVGGDGFIVRGGEMVSGGVMRGCLGLLGRDGIEGFLTCMLCMIIVHGG